MDRAGFVLAGGRSTRMGRDKALLRRGEHSLLEDIAGKVAEAAGWVGIIGDPERYGDIGFRVYADLRPGSGPMSGLEAALALEMAEWNLVVACDMPCLTVAVLSRLLGKLPENPKQGTCVAAVGPSGPEPLCAVYHASCLAAVRQAMARKELKMRKLLEGLQMVAVTGLGAGVLANVNTPAEWSAIEGGMER